MTVPAHGPNGRLRVVVKADSRFLRNNLPVVVRDARGAVVRRLTSGTTARLPAGLYSVTAVTPEGEGVVKHAQVGETGMTTVTFADPVAIEQPTSLADLSIKFPRLEESLLLEPADRHEPTELDVAKWGLVPAGHLHSVPSATVTYEERERTVAAAPIEQPTFRAELIIVVPGPGGYIRLEPAYEYVWLESQDGCEVADEDAAKWVFVPDGYLHRVPSGIFQVGDRRVRMSLPLNPRGTYPLNSCQVGVVATGNRARLQMSFPPERQVTRLVDGLVRHGEIAAGADVLRHATRLLLDKYSDPTGAALGGLTLDRMGLLGERTAWVENLARDFPWLPDGQVLLASLRRHAASPEERQEGLRLLLRAASQPPLYSDGLSLMMELLRRWPDEASKGERHDLLGKLADYSAYADWDSVNLSVELSAS